MSNNKYKTYGRLIRFKQHMNGEDLIIELAPGARRAMNEDLGYMLSSRVKNGQSLDTPLFNVLHNQGEVLTNGWNVISPEAIGALTSDPYLFSQWSFDEEENKVEDSRVKLVRRVVYQWKQFYQEKDLLTELWKCPQAFKAVEIEAKESKTYIITIQQVTSATYKIKSCLNKEELEKALVKEEFTQGLENFFSDREAIDSEPGATEILDITDVTNIKE